MKKVLIIAEAGVNHNGSIKIAKKLISEASKAGADIIKFQTFKADTLTTYFAPKAPYQKKNSKKKENQHSMLKRLELKYEYHEKLKIFCKKKKIEFLSSGFDISDLIFLNSLNLKRFKIPSGEITNYLYLKKIASFKKEVILSTGMSNLKEIENAIKILKSKKLKKKQIKILHCCSDYPAEISDINLKAIKTIKDKFNLEVGYSDHTTSNIVPSLAVMMGATIIEKHFTLDQKMNGPDHSASLDPENFKLMVKNIRLAEKSLGHGRKIPTKKEKINSKIVRKSIFAISDIKIGDKFTLKNIGCKRPDIGVSAIYIKKYLGKKSKKNYSKDQVLL
ncbi:N-acetylneuraminate synthase [Candidatus Pelagibacter sp.]|nr:N-acetylneuraminate synthase [Candidatus Pelagibacter sp.]